MSSEDTQKDAVTTFDIAQLRRVAKLLNIEAERTWTKDDFITAIQNKQDQDALMTAVFDNSTGPKPGFARVIIHRDPTPNHKNGPIHLSVNGRIISMPRGLEFDIPLPYVEVLKNAVTTVTEQSEQPSRDNPAGGWAEQARTSYPFQVTAATPGPFVNPHDGRAAKFAKRKAFFDMHGAWPTSGELKEFEKLQMAKAINSK